MRNAKETNARKKSVHTLIEPYLSFRDVHRRGLRLLEQLPVCPPRLKLPLRRKYIYFLNSITAAELHVGLDKIIAE